MLPDFSPLSVFIFVSHLFLSLCLSFHLYINLSLSFSIYLFIFLSVSLFLSLSRNISFSFQHYKYLSNSPFYTGFSYIILRRVYSFWCACILIQLIVPFGTFKKLYVQDAFTARKYK